MEEGSFSLTIKNHRTSLTTISEHGFPHLGLYFPLLNARLGGIQHSLKNLLAHFTGQLNAPALSLALYHSRFLHNIRDIVKLSRGQVADDCCIGSVRKPHLPILS